MLFRLRDYFKCAAILLVASVLLCSCDTVPVAPSPPAASSSANNIPAPVLPQPIDMAPGGSKPLAFQRVVINIEPGTTIGKFYWGPLKIERDTLKAPSPTVGSEQYAIIAREELRKYHYNLLGGENLIFGDDESAKARYQLGAQISALRLDIYATGNPWTGKTSSDIDGGMTADWQVYDTFEHKVVYTHTTQVSIKTDDTGESAIFIMFRKSLRQLLAYADFVAFMRPESANKSKASTGSSFTSAIKLTAFHQTKPLSLPADFPAIIDGVVTIKPGMDIGAGFIVTEDGFVLTAAHVVSGLKTVPVKLHNGLVLDAEVVRVDEETDVALLKLPGTSHKPIELATDPPAVGADVYAIGNPAVEELISSVTKGVVSGNRELYGHKLIQTDASANPGNSGGPLISKDGRAVGIVTSKIAGTGFEGLTFAVPINEAVAKLNLKFISATAN